ncbi:MAG TPA: bacteriohemerythrin [Nitrospirota bacterium]|nr:bacteriohemerythrin [Nitrospirota bacterium]
MGFLKWSKKYSVNVTEIDEQHKKLITLINEMYDAMNIDKGKDILGNVIANLVNYTVYHFNTEELLLQQYDYPHYKEHKELHDILSKKARNLKESFDHGKWPTTIDVMLLLTSWLNAHILVEDKKYEPYLCSKANR